ERREHGRHCHLDVTHRPDGVLDRGGQLQALGDRLVQLPIPANEGDTGDHDGHPPRHGLGGGTSARSARLAIYSSSAALPGIVFPAMNSSDAPPPVEMWLTLPAPPAWFTAATESPPPTTVRPRQAATARATASVPAANAGRSNTPIGPFQNTVRARAMR